MLKDLKSGSDIRGTALEGYGEEVNLTSDAVWDITNAFVVFLTKRLGKSDLTIGVGRDSRLSGEQLSLTVIDALKKSGTTILDASLASTPAMFYMTKCTETDCDGTIMITASHHPRPKNGLKFFTKAGGLESADIDYIISLAEQKERIDGTKTLLSKKDYMNFYCQNLIDYVRRETGEERPLEGFKIVVDAGNGAGGFFAERVLQPLGADTEGSQFLEPDGNFPNHVPNPEDKEAMHAISDCVVKHRADAGIIFDTDVDRAAVVTSDGTEINRNRLIALMSAILLEENPGAYIVTDSVTSDGLRKFIESKGGHHHRFKRGYKNVINEAQRLIQDGKNAVLAIETSGHAALRENFFQDDGAYLVTRILIKMAKLKKENKQLLSLIAGLEEPLESAEVRLRFLTEDFKKYGDFILENLRDFSLSTFSLEPSTYEGVRTNVDYAKGWFLARVSVHDPIMPVNIESSQRGGVNLIANLLYKFMSNFKDIDAQPLKRLTEI